MDVVLPFILTTIFAVSTFLLAHETQLGIVKSSAILGVVIGLMLHFEIMQSPLAAMLFGATFVGMSGKQFQLITIVLASLFYGLIFKSLQIHLAGIGGGLGTMACLACLGAILVQKIFEFYLSKDAKAKR